MPDPPIAGPNVTIEQGPQWLVDLYLTPPPWLNPALRVVGLLALLVVAYRLYRWDLEVPADTQLAMGRIAATVVGVITGVLAWANLTSQPYLVDVGWGLALGYTAVQAALSRPARRWGRSVVPEPRGRLSAAWGLLALLALLLPALVNVNGQGMALFSARLVVAGVAIGMVFLNLHGLRDGVDDSSHEPQHEVTFHERDSE